MTKPKAEIMYRCKTHHFNMSYIADSECDQCYEQCFKTDDPLHEREPQLVIPVKAVNEKIQIIEDGIKHFESNGLNIEQALCGAIRDTWKNLLTEAGWTQNEN